MTMFFGALSKNGEILNLVDCGNNNYMVSINIGNQRSKIPNYYHIKTDKNGILVVNSNLGSEVINNSEECVIVRDSRQGYYIYNLILGKKVSGYYDSLKFMDLNDDKYIFATDMIRNNIGTIFIQLNTVLNYNGEIVSEVFNATTSEFYKDIKEEKDYLLLKQSIQDKINCCQNTDEEIYQKLLKRKR